MFYVDDEPEGKFLHTETINCIILYCILLYCNHLKYRPFTNFSLMSKAWKLISVGPPCRTQKENHLTSCGKRLLIASENKQFSVLTFPDLSAAFGTIDHAMLIRCLQPHFGVFFLPLLSNVPLPPTFRIF